MPRVAVFILTDGHENASRKWNKTKIAKEIKKLQKAPYNWDFFFAAANQDAMAEGKSALGYPSRVRFTVVQSHAMRLPIKFLFLVHVMTRIRECVRSNGIGRLTYLHLHRRISMTRPVRGIQYCHRENRS